MTRDRRRRALPSRADAWTAGVAGVVGVAGSFAYAGPTTDFVAVPVTDWVVATTPGVVVTVAIQRLGKASEALAVGVALALSVALLAAAVAVGVRVGRRLDEPAGPVLGAYAAAWTAAAVVLRAPFPALAAAVPAAAVVGVRAVRGEHPSGFPGRRRVLRTAAGLAGTVGVATMLGLHRQRVAGSPLAALPATEREQARDRLAAARERSLDVAGIPGLVSPVERFYEVDINPVNPDVNAGGWTLSVTGAVEREQEFSYGDLTSRAAEHRVTTLRCVGEPLNGHEMDTAVWTGVPVADLLAAAGPRGGCECVMLRAADGYYEEFPLAALRPGLLAYGMNGRLLPRAHGYPVRALVPGHWGEVNVKWLTEIEVLEREARGFWEKRGWHGTGPVNTVAKLHAVNRLADGRVQVAGHAYAGTRGVRAVEVSTDGGDTWQDARLSRPLPDDDAWRQWAYEFQPTGTHEVVVRAIEADGTVQPRERTDAYPSGPTGWVSRTIRA